jgi:hypothetical protein
VSSFHLMDDVSEVILNLFPKKKIQHNGVSTTAVQELRVAMLFIGILCSTGWGGGGAEGIC